MPGLPSRWAAWRRSISICAIESGYQCPQAGRRCNTVCGDGITAGLEACDDGNGNANDGCAECRQTPGFQCAGSPSVCRATRCGDGVVEGIETCEDGNDEIGDGCANCQLEPGCSGGTCIARCGDGAIFDTEECDDGNTRNNDGCDDACRLEAGFACTSVTTTPPPSVTIPIVYRDFRGRDLPGGHPDFQRESASERGIVRAQWGTDRKPVFKTGAPTSTTTSAARFDEWYNSRPGVNITIPGELTLARQQNGTYVFENTRFFPLDGRGWIAQGSEQPRDGGHNFHFTSELRFWFGYDGNPLTLSFFGDDDVFVFINGTLAVDIGGIHGPENGSITINAANQASFQMVPGGVYEAAVFQAERRVTGSQYKLTLAGFFPPRSSCTSVCDDGIVAGNEVCDDGVNDGSYGSCLNDCSGRGPFCGDGVRSDGEVCDDGVNVGAYGGCAAGCGAVVGCGDGVVSRPQERCDDGINDGRYNGCAVGCQARGPFCGDRSVQQSNGETCDDGFNDGRYGGCTNQCLVGPRCGDGVLQGSFEACDRGTANNTGGYNGCTGHCRSDCTGQFAFCGDGIVNGNEVCDDGFNDGRYNGCAAGCAARGPRCGDGITQGTEQCDDGNTVQNDGCFNDCRINIGG